MAPRKPDAVPNLAAYPFVVVRVACTMCLRRTGSYRLARLAARFGPGTLLEKILAQMACTARYPEEPNWRQEN